MHNIANTLDRLDLEVKGNQREDKALQILQTLIIKRINQSSQEANLAFIKLMGSC